MTHTKTNSLLNLIISLLFGIIFAIIYYLNFLQLYLISKEKIGLILLLLILSVTCICYLLVDKLIIPKLISYTIYQRIYWIIGSFLAGIWLVFAIPMPSPKPLATYHDLKVVINGQQNPIPQSSEIRINGLFRSNGKQVPISEFALAGNWLIDNNVVIVRNNLPAKLYWKGKTCNNLRLEIEASAWSGKVKVTWDGKKEVVDINTSTKETQEIPLDIEISTTPWYFYAFIYIGEGLLIGMILLSLSLWAVLISVKPKTLPENIRVCWIKYAVPMILIWVIYLLAFWPGIMISDSFDQWNQMVTGVVNDHHPAFHTFYMWLITRIWYSPAAVALFQIALFSLVISFGLGILVKHGISNYLAWVASILIAISPINATMVINLWKDTVYSIMFIILAIIFLLLYFSRGKWLNSIKNIIFISIVAVLISLFRHNGFPLALGSLFFLLVIYRQYFKKIILSLFISISLYLIITGPIYNHFNIAPIQPILYDALQFHHIAAHLKANTYFSPEEISFLNNIRNTNDDWNYNCYNVNPTIFSDKFNANYVIDKSNILNKLLLSAFIRNPSVDIDLTLCCSKLIWMIQIPEDGFMDAVGFTSDGSNISTLHPPRNDYRNGLWEDSKLEIVEKQLAKIIFFTLQSKALSILWRPALYIYLFIFGLFIYLIKNKDFEILIIMIPMVLHYGMLFIITLHQSLRYAYPIIPFFMLLWPLLFILIERRFSGKE